MTEATAYRLKQIMTQEHLSLTQAAKQIGISASSMRKVLKDTPMSRPITFKINRFIEEHPVQQAKNSFTIFDSAEEEAKSAAPKKTNSAAAQAPQAKQSEEAPAKPQSNQKETKQPAKNHQSAQGEGQQATQRRRGRRKSEQAQADKAHKTDKPQDQPKAKTQQHQVKAASKQTKQSDANTNQQSASEKKNRSARRVRKIETSDAERHTNGKTAQGRPEQHQKTRSNKPQPQQPVTSPTPAVPTAAAQIAPTSAQSTSTATSVPATQPNPASTKASAAATERTESHPARQDKTILIYMDESFGGGSDYQRNMSIGATVVDPDDEQALKPFMQTLYPFGWQPGDEVKARGKAREQLEAMLQHANTDHAATYAVYSPLSDTGNFSLSFGILYPYVAALIRILDALPTKPTKVRVAMDRRSEITDEQLAMAARMLHAYVKAQTGRDVIFMFRTTDSKQTIGVQYSDFVSHAAMIFGPEQIKNAGINKLPAIGTQLGDQLQLFAMVGLQKYLLDDGATQDEAPQPFKNPLLNAADRMTHLAEKAADMPDVPEDTFAQAKLVVNQLLQIAPSSVAGAINKMPFQNWYDILARTAALLHYTDESLPPFRIDPDAMQIATDALNNIQALLAGAR